MAILEKEIWVRLHSTTIKYYENLGYEIPRKKDKYGGITTPSGTTIVVKIEDLPPNSNQRVTKICDDCPVNSLTRIIRNQKYVDIIKRREKTDGKDRCLTCGNKYVGKNKKNNVKYEKSALYYCKQNNKEYVINEFSDKNLITMNEISYGTEDAYLWICPNFGQEHEYKMNMNNRTIHNINCPYCAGRRANHTNCLSTTHPEITRLLWNPEDGYKYTSGSAKKVHFKCLDCGGKINNKTISDIVKLGWVSCPRCSDGISYPEKFMANVLSQLNIEFETQKSFDWAIDKRYDFFISSLNCIIETHGEQHYTKSFNGRTLVEEKENDSIKQRLAKNHGVQLYLIIDCAKSELEYIKNNIYKSELSMFDLNKIDWLKCHEYACKSFVKIACDIWNIGNKSTNDIAKILNVNYNTVSKYLKQGSKIGLCNYDPKEERKKIGIRNGGLNGKIVVRLDLDDNFIDEFDNASEASRQLNIKNISRVCLGKYKSAGGFKWMYKEDYENSKAQNKSK